MTEKKATHTPAFHKCGCIPRRDQSIEGNTIQFCPLHAATPALLEAAKALMPLADYPPEGYEAEFAALEAAIAKVEGGAQ